MWPGQISFNVWQAMKMLDVWMKDNKETFIQQKKDNKETLLNCYECSVAGPLFNKFIVLSLLGHCPFLLGCGSKRPYIHNEVFVFI